MSQSTYRRLKKQAALRLTAMLALVAVVFAIGWKLQESLVIGVAYVIPLVFMLREAILERQLNARTIKQIQADSLANWSFSPFLWKAQMKREAEEHHAKRPRWIIP